MDTIKSEKHNPFPTIGCIALDKDIKVIDTKFFERSEYKVEINDAKDPSWTLDNSFKKITKKRIKFKTVITDKGEIYIVYADPSKNQSTPVHKHLPELDEDEFVYDRVINLRIITLGKITLKYFISNEPAVYLNDKIYLKDPENSINHLNIDSKKEKFTFKPKSGEDKPAPNG